MRAKNENVFTSDEVLRAHTKYILPDSTIYNEVAGFIHTKVDGFNNILDVGCGKGDFSLPILKVLEERNIEFCYDGFDISDEMLKNFKNNINTFDVEEKRINLWQGDAIDEIQKLTKTNSGRYDVVIISFVLHYFKDWKKLLFDVEKLLKPGGVLIQVSVFGIYSFLAGRKEAKMDTPKEVAEFWLECFRQKEELGFENRWVNYIDTIALSDVRSYIEEQLPFEETARKTFSWQRVADFNTLLNWIKVSPVSSITGGLSPLEREKLSNAMHTWLQKNKYDLSINYKLPYYWEVFIHGK